MSVISCDARIAEEMLTFGFFFVTDSLLDDGRDWVQVRFPRSKKARIRKKWRKQRKNYDRQQVRDPKIYKVGNMVVCHPNVMSDIKGSIR